MFRSLVQQASRHSLPLGRLTQASCPSFHGLRSTSTTASFPRYFSSSSGMEEDNAPSQEEMMRFLHHGKRPRFRANAKFKSPQRRASKLLHDLNKEAVQKSKESKPAVWETHFEVGDAIECEVVEQGGVNSTDRRKVRGIVIGIFRRSLDTKVLIRDVVLRTPVERMLNLHSPMVLSLKVLEKNFVYKGKRKVKRAKLYFLRHRNPNDSRVTKGRV